MHVHQPRGDDQTGGLDDLRPVWLHVAPDHRHPAVLQQNIHDAADAPNRVDEPSLTDEQSHGKQLLCYTVFLLYLTLRQ